MIRVNLLPPEIKKARRMARQQLYIGIGVAVLVVIMLLGNLVLRYQTAQLRRQADSVQEHREAVEVSVQEHEPYVVLDARVRERAALLQRVMGAPPQWTRIMRSMGDKIPEHVWLTDLRMVVGEAGEEGEEEPGQVMLRGYTYEHPDTADWLDTLKGMPGLDDVRCAFSIEETQDRFLLVEFEVSSQLLPGEDFQPPEVGDYD